jgi:hypothetical protein
VILTDTLGLRSLLYINQGSVRLQYAHLEEYFAARGHNIILKNDTVPPKDRPNILIDITSHTPLRSTLPSVNILPYIYLYLTYKRIRFHFLTSNDNMGLLLTDIAGNVIYRHEHHWRRHILESGHVKEVRVWWGARCIDIVLKAGSQWAIDWDCQKEESVEIVALKKTLGLIPAKPKQWKGAVVVASVED